MTGAASSGHGLDGLVLAIFVVLLALLKLDLPGAALAAVALGLLAMIALMIYIVATSGSFHRRYGVYCPNCGANLDAPYGFFGTGPLLPDWTQCRRCGATTASEG